jgi:hypothetical protein
VPVLAHFPTRTRGSAVEKWFQNFGLNFFCQSKLTKGFFVEFLVPELTLTKKNSNQNLENTFAQQNLVFY